MVKRKGKDSSVVKYDTDVVARNTWLLLLRDFRATEGEKFSHLAELAFNESITKFRDFEFPELGHVPVGRFKRYKQLASLLKKYRFSNDMYDDTSLYKLTAKKFFREQERICTYQQPTQLCFNVLQRARGIAKRILGSYDPDKTLTSSKFGKKSSIGCPLSLAYIDEKLSNVEAFSGSKKCSSWFLKHSLPGDAILQELVTALGPLTKLEHESLNLVLVPKTWKVLRPITPLTLLALYYSYGVGEQVIERLQDENLSLSRLQQRHRRYVEKFSLSRTHATADLSSASDSLTSELLNRVLPREWYRAIAMTFSRQLIFDGESYYTASVLPMGNGLTFPVETLVFYSILQAIKELSEVRGIVSVYGDDLIYPSAMHKFVAYVFPRIGLKLNLDKTFVKAHFRESCGSDSYYGSDVRPAFISGQHQLLSRSAYRCFLYKTLNSLRRRWSDLEIPGTIRWLLAELTLVSGELLRVPMSFPDTSGIKVDDPTDILLGTDFLPWSPVKKIFLNGSQWYLFSYLVETPGRRSVKTMLPYYWLALQGLDDEPELNFEATPVTARSIDRNFPVSKSASIQWNKQVFERSFIDRTGRKRLVRKEKFTASVASRTGGSTVAKTTRAGSISYWV